MLAESRLGMSMSKCGKKARCMPELYAEPCVGAGGLAGSQAGGQSGGPDEPVQPSSGVEGTDSDHATTQPFDIPGAEVMPVPGSKGRTAPREGPRYVHARLCLTQ